MKKIGYFGVVLGVLLVTVGHVSAHVSVQPKEVVAGYTVAAVRVPNEKDIATTGVRVVVPNGVEVHGIMPIPDWTHTEKREATVQSVSDDDGYAEESTGRITEVIWTGGKIGAGEFMEFPLSVKYSTDSESVTWRAYQSYADGEVVPWDGSDEKHPASVVSVMKQAVSTRGAVPKTSDQSIWMNVVALLLSVTAFAVALKKK